MSSDLRDLYQEVILDHGKRPRNFRRLDQPSCSADGYNPLCGDHFMLDLRLDGGRIADIAFEGAGCAISTASASLMTEAIKGRTVEEARQLFKKFHRLILCEAAPEDGPPLGKLEVFSGVHEYPTRVKCATLAWHALCAALDGRHDTVSTE